MVAEQHVVIASDETLDARGLRCPLTFLAARKRYLDLAPGSVFDILADDGGARNDLTALCEATGAIFAELPPPAPGQYLYRIRKPA